MSVPVNVNGKAINYPQTGDTNWGDEATNFAVETSAALAKIGLSTGTTVSIPGTLSVTGTTTLNSTLSVTGTTSLTGNVTATNNLTVNGNTTLGNANTDTTTVTGIVNIDLGTLYVDPVNNRVGVNKTNPAQALDVTGNIAISGNETVGGTLGVTGAVSLSSNLAVTGNSTLTGNLSVNGNTTLGDASGDSLTINGKAVSIPNGLNIDSDTFVIDATNNRVGIGVSSPTVPVDIQANTSAFGINIRGRASDNIGLLRFLNNAGTYRHGIALWSDDSLNFQNASSTNLFNIAQAGQISAVVPSGTTLYPGYLCRAWVNFNGTTASPSTIRGSGNVSSVTKNATGDYTINFAIAMPDINYSIAICIGGTSGAFLSRDYSDLTSRTASLFRIITTNNSTNSIDPSQVNISVFR